MNYINITVRGKMARAEEHARVVCGNSDYTVRFDFDEEWAEYAVKTARFVSEDGSYTDVQFEGSDCTVPILRNTRTLLVGVFAGNLRTTTAALIHAVPCITDPDGTPADPTPDVYAQLMERFNAMEAPAAVLYTAQELTDEQKATARNNIGVSKPDWEQNAETAADYIKNRPFYDNTVIVPFASTPTAEPWQIAPMAADEFFNNVSSYTVRYRGTDYHLDRFSDVSWRGMEFRGAGGMLEDSPYSGPFTSNDIPFVIFRRKLNGSYDGTVAYVGKYIHTPPEDQDITIIRSNIKQIDPKFIPDNRFTVTVTEDGNGGCTADKTIAEIVEAYESEKDVVASFAGQELPLHMISNGNTAVFDLSTLGETSQGLIIGRAGVILTNELIIPRIYPVEKTSAMTDPVGVDSDGKLWGKADVSLNMTGATVGQIAKITAVDDSGKPTEWETADAVNSVNNQTGSVTLTAGDVGALRGETVHYWSSSDPTVPDVTKILTEAAYGIVNGTSQQGTPDGMELPAFVFVGSMDRYYRNFAVIDSVGQHWRGRCDLRDNTIESIERVYGENFIVNLTIDANGTTADKTFSEIKKAAESGKSVALAIGGPSRIPLLVVTDSIAIFQAMLDSRVTKVTCESKNGSDTWDLGIMDMATIADAHSLNITTGASAGQIAKITAVDASGKPTSWEAVDMPNSLPSVAAEDNGKFLRVVSGSWTAVTVDNANGVSF